jgi:Spy/CpxP family protein refolding chaperone
MNARFARVLSRVSLVSVVAVAALGAAACNGNANTGSAPAAAETTQAAPVAASENGPGHRLFAQVVGLDLRPEQRASVDEIEQNLRADLAPHRETLRQVATLMANSIESGRLDPADAAAQQAALAAGILEAKATFAGAMNAVHDVLDKDQRAALVASLEEQRLNHSAHGDDHGPIAKLALEIGLNDEQKASLRDAVQQGVDEVFPNRKARREEGEARMKALAEAFVTEDFDAADHDLGGGAERSLESFATLATRTVDISGRVLSVSQREALAAMVRQHAEKI